LFQVRGRFEVTMDAKGRLPLPVRLREPLIRADQSSLVLTAYEGGLHAYTVDRWRRIERRMASRSVFDRRTRAFLHSFVATATEVRIDAQGRMNIPPPLRRKAGLSGSCVVLSYLWMIEIWDVDRWAAQETAAAKIVAESGGLEDFVPFADEADEGGIDF
jgi:MraZ protein